MEYELTKLLSLFVYPLGSTFLLFAIAAALFAYQRRRAGAILALFAMAWLWTWSMPLTSHALNGALERRYPHLPAEAAPQADAAVVLGGAFTSDPAWPYPMASDAVNRYWHGARLYYAGRVKMIILTGGRDPERPDKLTEAQAGAIFVADMGVPADAILLDNVARRTQQHVSNVSRLLEENGLKSFLLVTSATHMRRAEAVFRAGGLDPIPVATDFNVPSTAPIRLRDFVPSAKGLNGSTEALHEYVGYWYYQLRGWI